MVSALRAASAAARTGAERLLSRTRVAFWLSRFEPPDFPVVVGVIRAVERHTYDEGVAAQIGAAQEKKGRGDLRDLIYSGDMWEVT